LRWFWRNISREGGLSLFQLLAVVTLATWRALCTATMLARTATMTTSMANRRWPTSTFQPFVQRELSMAGKQSLDYNA